jgi:predicted Fe-Mo cluster-binding NifX family protein
MGVKMRIALSTDQDFVSSCFGCCPACTIIDIEAGDIRRTLSVPNPGWQHRQWADFLERNSVKCLIVGNIGANAMAVLKWRGIPVISGVQGCVDAVVRKYVDGTLAASGGACDGEARTCLKPGGTPSEAM